MMMMMMMMLVLMRGLEYPSQSQVQQMATRAECKCRGRKNGSVDGGAACTGEDEQLHEGGIGASAIELQVDDRRRPIEGMASRFPS